ncbi:MAG TPA: hypothetical protein VHX63_04810 [Acidobacteriaceae bacterium]|jgi:hypothetical protein|nr:hypothetical protein [Acidobacteriaceae bacterium]
MKPTLIFLAGCIIGIGVARTPRFLTHIHLALLSAKLRAEGRAEQRIHTEETFEFTVAAPPGNVAALFGAEKERAWAPGWNPQFIWPSPAVDQEGMVFTVAHGDKNAVWISTLFEPRTGHYQYVYVIPDVVATVVALQWNPQGTYTHVTVKYDRTALNVAANPIVQEMAKHDAKSGPEWQKQLGKYLGSAG